MAQGDALALRATGDARERSVEIGWTRLDEGLDALWATAAAEAEGTTWFHTPQWAALFERVFPRWRRAPLALRFDDGQTALVPLLERRGPLPGTGHHESVPPGVYGGPLFSRPAREAHWRGVWRALDALPSVFVYGNPFNEPRALPERGTTRASTRVIDLAPGADAVRAAMRYSFRWGIKKAVRDGYEVGLARTAGDVDAYDALYRASLERWGKAAHGHHPRRLFEELFDLSRSDGEDGPVRLWVARHAGRVVAGAWLFAHRDHVDYWHGAADAVHMARYPVHLMIDEALRDACVSGRRWFDFNPSGGLEGVEAFKRGFGAELREFDVLARFTPAARAYRRWRRLLEKHAGRCPL
jgi:hypothetical protein